VILRTILSTVHGVALVDAPINALFDGHRIAFGRRKPHSVPGHWDGAAVVVKEGNKIVFAVFQDQKDYILNCSSISQALFAYMDYVDQGWNVMTNEDVTESSGMSIDSETITEELIF